MYEFTIDGQTFNIEVGSTFKLKDPYKKYGHMIKALTEDFDVTAVKTIRVGQYTEFKVTEITERTEPIFTAEKPLTKMLKSELVEYADMNGIEIDPKATKAKIIETIENKYK